VAISDALPLETTYPASRYLL